MLIGIKKIKKEPKEANFREIFNEIVNKAL
jgi:hypothetical protein